MQLICLAEVLISKADIAVKLSLTRYLGLRKPNF